MAAYNDKILHRKFDNMAIGKWLKDAIQKFR